MIARVFPRKTKASPTDRMAFFGPPRILDPLSEISEVHISVAFTWDIPKAEKLAKAWEGVAPVKIGGPAFNSPSGSFTPGVYLKPGYTITSRGCPNRCWFCSVWKREPRLVELPIQPGTNILDDNLLACSLSHVQSVFDMLREQKGRIIFTGGLEAKLLTSTHINLFDSIRSRIELLYFAFDTPDDEIPLQQAGKLLSEVGFPRYKLRAYVLIGFPGDSFSQAESRLKKVLSFGFLPMAMLYRDSKGILSTPIKQWKQFSRNWIRPALFRKYWAGEKIFPSNQGLF